MKALPSFRLWLLIVLAVLLPVRGAVAAAMLCPVAGSGMQNEWRAAPAGHVAMDHAMAHGAADHGDHADHGAHGAHDSQPPQQDHDAAGHDQAHAPGQASDQCNMCSAYCSITPLIQAVPDLPAPLDPPAIRFPDPSSPAPSFLSGGQERPPRGI